MQWPPRPGPGLKLMNPNGFVAAASTTSQTSMSIRSQSCASSLTSAMLTERKMFSSSFVSSAASGDETVCTVPIARAVQLGGAARAVLGDPADDLRHVLDVPAREPGSTRSGENARWKSSPAFSPVDSRIGSSCSRVVPGYVVDSSTTRCPSRRRFAISGVAARTIERSGSRCFESGVGSAIRIASAPRSSS